MAATLGYLLATASALLWSGLDAARKRLAEGRSAPAILFWLSVGQLPPFLLWAAIERGPLDLEPYLPLFVASVALQALANLLFLHAVSISPLSATIPFLALSPVFATVAAWLFLGETPSPLQLGGIGAVLLGAAVLHQKRGRSLWAALREERGSLMMIAVAALWATTGVIDKAALRYATVPAHAALQSVGVALVIGPYLWARGRSKELGPKGDLGAMLLAIAVGTAALGAQLWAVRLIFVGAVDTLKRGVGLAMSVLLGRLLFGEPVTLQKLLSILLMAAGVALLIWG